MKTFALQNLSLKDETENLDWQKTFANCILPKDLYLEFVKNSQNSEGERNSIRKEENTPHEKTFT